MESARPLFAVAQGAHSRTLQDAFVTRGMAFGADVMIEALSAGWPSDGALQRDLARRS